MRAGLAPPAPRRTWRRRTASRPIVGEGNGSRTPSAATETDPRAGERRMGASASLRSKLDFRLEHELQPWWDGSAPPRGDHAVASAVGSLRKRGSPPAARQIPVASSLRDRLCRARRIPRRVIMSAGTVASGVCHSLMAREHCGGCAGCPDGDRTGTCQHILLKAAGRELASRSADLPRDLRRSVTARATGRSPQPHI